MRKALKARNPDAVIFLGTIFAGGSPNGVVTTNSVIRQIAEKYENVMGVVDCNDGSLYGGANHSILHPFENNVHFGKVGNLMVAKHWMDSINTIVETNPGLFEIPMI